MACSTLQKDKSLERPEIWKRRFLKTNGVFYFAERQELRAHRKMETPLFEDQWHVLLCRQTGRQRADFLKINGTFYFAERPELRAPRKMETPLSEDQWHVLLRRKTRASSVQKYGNAAF